MAKAKRARKAKVEEQPKVGEQPKRYGTLIRVSEPFAEAVRKAASFEGLSMADFAEAALLPVVERRYREAVLREARRVGGGGEA